MQRSGRRPFRGDVNIFYARPASFADAVFYPANAGSQQGNIELFGECRDVTTTKAEAGSTEPLTFD